MKTTFAILVAGLIFLATPILATAHGGDRHDSPRQHKSWVKDKHNHDYNRYDRNHKWEKRQATKHYKKQLRKQRQEHRRFVRHQRPHRPQHLVPAVLLGVPRIVFRIGW